MRKAYIMILLLISSSLISFPCRAGTIYYRTDSGRNKKIEKILEKIREREERGERGEREEQSNKKSLSNQNSFVNGYRNLTRAIEHNILQDVKDILEEHSSLIKLRGRGTRNTLLMKACKYRRRVKIIEYLLENGASDDIDAVNSNGETALSIALVNKVEVKVIRLLLDYRAYWKSSEHSSHIVNVEDIEIVKLMVDENIDLDATDDTGITILMRAAERGDATLVKYLIENDADVDLEDNNDLTALDYAVSSDNEEVISLIKGDDTSTSFTGEVSPEKLNAQLILAVKKDNYATVKELVIKGADTNFIDDDGYSSLHYSALTDLSKSEVSDLTNKKGSKKRLINSKEEKSLTMRAKSMWRKPRKINNEILEFLLKNSEDVDIQDNMGNTALLLAMFTCKSATFSNRLRVNNNEAIRLFIKYNANVHLANDFGQSPVDLVKKYNFSGLSDILLNKEK